MTVNTKEWREKKKKKNLDWADGWKFYWCDLTKKIFFSVEVKVEDWKLLAEVLDLVDTYFCQFV